MCHCRCCHCEKLVVTFASLVIEERTFISNELKLIIKKPAKN